jgi:predicted methyltransferase
MATFIVRRVEDTGQREPDVEIAIARAKSMERHLTGMGIHPANYDVIYEMAVQLYNQEDIKGPFGVDWVVKAAQKFNQKLRPVVEFKKVEKNKVECMSCSGTGLKFDKGKIVYADDKKPVKCDYCNQ